LQYKQTNFSIVQKLSSSAPTVIQENITLVITLVIAFINIIVAGQNIFRCGITLPLFNYFISAIFRICFKAEI